MLLKTGSLIHLQLPRNLELEAGPHMLMHYRKQPVGPLQEGHYPHSYQFHTAKK